LNVEKYIREGMSPETAVGRMMLNEISNCVWEQHTNHLFIDEKPDTAEIERELMYYGIHEAWYNPEDSKLHLLLSRPGVLIGVKGSNLDIITNHLKAWAKKNKLKFKGIKIIEDRYPIKDDILSSVISYGQVLSGEY